MPDITPLILLVFFFGVLEMGTVIFSVFDLTRPERRVRGDNKIVWILVIVFIWMLGPLLYLAVGRESLSADSSGAARVRPFGADERDKSL